MNHPVPTDPTSLSCTIRVRAAAVCILIIPPRPCHYSSHEDRDGEHLKTVLISQPAVPPLIITIVADCSWTRGGKKMQRGRSLQKMKTDGRCSHSFMCLALRCDNFWTPLSRWQMGGSRHKNDWCSDCDAASTPLLSKPRDGDCNWNHSPRSHLPTSKVSLRCLQDSVNVTNPSIIGSKAQSTRTGAGSVNWNPESVSTFQCRKGDALHPTSSQASSPCGAISEQAELSTGQTTLWAHLLRVAGYICFKIQDTVSEMFKPKVESLFPNLGYN